MMLALLTAFLATLLLAKCPMPNAGSLDCRCIWQCFPMAYLVEHADGQAITGKERILDILPTKVHERRPIFLGSAKDVERVAEHPDHVQMYGWISAYKCCLSYFELALLSHMLYTFLEKYLLPLTSCMTVRQMLVAGRAIEPRLRSTSRKH